MRKTIIHMESGYKLEVSATKSRVGTTLEFWTTLPTARNPRAQRHLSTTIPVEAWDRLITFLEENKP